VYFGGFRELIEVVVNGRLRYNEVCEDVLRAGMNLFTQWDLRAY